ncbi:MAG: amino acid adenylation domain-containing protein [Vulcanimicrobiota bacterium]
MIQCPPNYNLALPFWSASLKYPDRLALVADVQLTYQELAARVVGLANWLGPARRVAILASRSAGACQAVLACAWTGATYLPLGLDWPEARLSQVLRSFQPEALLTDERGQSRLTPSLTALAGRQTRADLPLAGVGSSPALVGEESLAYVIFTSGSSGLPKGVRVRCQAVRQLLSRLARDTGLNQGYRMAGNFELSFDGSVFDMLACWENAGTLYPVPRAQAMAPHSFLAQHRIQACLLTPAQLHMMLALKAPPLPELRWCAFGAEALPTAALEKWRQLAPQASLFNLYGPTEGTVAWLWHRADAPGEDDLVPLGRPFSGLEAEVVDPAGEPVPHGQEGELLLIGDQLTPGYWRDPELTGQSFLIRQGRPAYRTGDRVRQDEHGLFHFLGRLDHQVKIRGCRVELEEVERALRRTDPHCQAVVLSWPEQPGRLNQLVAFVAGSQLSQAQLWQGLRASLPEYMLPAQLQMVSELPTTANGKIDRARLRSRLEP